MHKKELTLQTCNKVALAYQEKFMNVNLYQDTYDLFCQKINNEHARILEIGCGPGNITKYLLAKHPTYQIHAIDYAEEMITLAKKNNPTAHFETMDCTQINSLTSRFDAILCGFCMPYLSKKEVVQLMADCHGLLNKNGILYCSTMEGDYSQSKFETGSTGDKAYVYYYTEMDVHQYLLKNNFMDITLQHKQYEKANGNVSSEMIFIASKK